MGSPNSSTLLSAVLAIGGTAVDMFVECAKDKNGAAFLGVAGGAWLGPLGAVAGAVAGLGANRLASALDRREEARRAARELLINDDIARAQAAAVRERIRGVRRDMPAWRIVERSRLEKLAETSGEWWLAVVRDEARRWLDVVSEREFVDTLTDHLAAERRTPPGPVAWRLVLAKAQAHSGVSLDDASLEALADELSTHFVNDSFNAIKSDPRAFASIVMRFLAQTLVELRQQNEANAGLREAADKLVAAAKALDLLEQLPKELQRLTEEVRDAKQAALQAAQDARQTKELVLDRLMPQVRTPIQLPPPAQEFFGRKPERAKLLELLRDAHVTCFVVGIAGMGKTALAAEVVAELVGPKGERLAASDFPDGVLFLDGYKLHGDADAVCSVLVETLEPALLTSGANPSAAARRACHSKRLLVVLEGAEELADSLARVLEVFGAGAKVLVLTRSPSQAVPGRTVDLDQPLSREDGLRLLRRFAPDVSENLLAATQDRLGGHPYALTLAGHLLGAREEAPAEFVRELVAADFPSLRESADPRRGLDWLFRRSLEHLSSDARELLAACGSAALAPLSIDFAQAALDDTQGARARAAMKELVRRSWLRLRANAPEAWQFGHVLAYQFAGQLDGALRGRSSGPTQDRLAEWARLALERQLEARDPAGLAALRAAAEHALALLARRATSNARDPLLNLLLYAAPNRFKVLGLLSLTRRCVECAAATLDSFPESARSASWSRERSMAWLLLGDVRIAQGDLANARGSYEAAKSIAQKLAASDPTNAQWQRDLSVSLNKLGDVQLAQGDLANARGSYEASETIRQKLAVSDPTNAQWQRDLSVSLNQLGDVQLAQGDLANARGSYEASETIRQKLAASDPTNAPWQRDLGVSLSKLGDVQLAQGDLANARGSYEAAKSIAQRLGASDPTNTEWLRDLGVGLDKLGNVQLAQVDLANARGSYEAAKSIAQKLTTSDPTNTEWQRDLGVSMEKLGNVQLAQGDLANARGSYDAAKSIAQKLAASDPTNAEWQHDLAVSHMKLGDVARRQGDSSSAQAAFKAGLAIVERLVALDPTNATWRRDLAWFREQLAES